MTRDHDRKVPYINEIANPSHILRTLAWSWSPWNTARKTTLCVSSPCSNQPHHNYTVQYIYEKSTSTPT